MLKASAELLSDKTPQWVVPPEVVEALQRLNANPTMSASPSTGVDARVEIRSEPES